MRRRTDVEFLSGGADPEPDDDVLELGRKRRLPIWAWVMASAALIGLVVAGAMSLPSSNKPERHTSQAPPTITRVVPSDVSMVEVVAGFPARAIVTGGRVTWVLQDHRVVVLDDLREFRATKSVSAVPTDPDDPPELLLGAGHDRLWVIANHDGVGRITRLSAFLLIQEHVTPIGPVQGAAVLDDELFVISGRSLIEFVNDEPRVRATSPVGELYGIAADPAHRRLLLVDAAFPTRLWAYRPGGRLTSLATLPLTKASLAVADGHLWIGGFGTSGPVLERVDGGRTYPSRVSDQLGPGAVIVAGGQHVVWVRDGDPNSGGLWCVDATTGRAAQQWDIAGQVASTNGTAVVANASGLLQLDLAGCRG